ncbi:MAG TPA: S-adenosylmethionine decarboxylase [Thermosynechococcaceae cyanobacterium]
MTTTDAIASSAAPTLLHLLQTTVQAAGLTPVAEATATFSPQGVSVVLLLEESHVALHVWTEYCKATVDIHVCDYQQDNYAKAQKLAVLLAIALTDGDRAQWHYSEITG